MNEVMGQVGRDWKRGEKQPAVRKAGEGQAGSPVRSVCLSCRATWSILPKTRQCPTLPPARQRSRLPGGTGHGR